MVSTGRSYLLVLLACLVTPPFTLAQTQRIRINCGGPEGKSGDGSIWMADAYYEGGKSFVANATISGTVDDFLYQTERWQNPSLKYNVPLANGQYDVNLLFSENYPGAMKIGAREFEVYMEGTMAMTVDIFKEAGAGNKALTKSYRVTVTDGALNIEFRAKENNPKCGAIEIVSLDGSTVVHPDIRHVAKVVGDTPKGMEWADSYSVGNRCYCDKVTTYDHGIAPFFVKTPLGWKTVKEICQMLGPGPGSRSRPIYNDVQCGNGPPNDAGDEHTCPGRVDMGPMGCGHIGPKWNFQELVTNGSTETQRVFVDAGGPTDKPNLVSGDKTWTYVAPTTFSIKKNGAIPASVYRSHRSGQSFKYTFDGFVPARLYRVSLGFAEVWEPNCANGKRVMSILVNGNLYVNNLDVFKEAGCGGALVKTYVVAADGQGNIQVEIRASVEKGMVSSLEIMVP
jgi:hypothetical protein